MTRVDPARPALLITILYVHNIITEYLDEIILSMAISNFYIYYQLYFITDFIIKDNKCDQIKII